jgi:predicted  nucleic acid-binding Zn-ribbon protein
MADNELHETIAAKGQLEKAIARMVVEDTTAAMAKSLGSFMDRMEREELARTARYESIVKGVISEAVQPLMNEFSAFGETVTNLMLDVDDLKGTVAAHDREIASFRQSRDESIAERQELRSDLAESKQDRASIHQELTTASHERQAMMRQLERILNHLGLAGDVGASE